MMPPEEPAEAKPDAMQAAREALLARTFRFIALFGLLAVLGSISRAFSIGWQPVLSLHIGIYVLALAVVGMSRYISYRTRALILFALLLLTATAGLIAWGLIGLGLPLLVLFSTLATLLFGMRAGLVALGIAALVLITTGQLVQSGIFAVALDLDRYMHSWTSWLNAMTALVLITGIIVWTAGHLVRQLNEKIGALERSEASLRRETERNALILHTALDGFAIINMDTRFIEVNGAFCRMLGYSREELLHLAIHNLEAVERPEEVRAHADKVAAQGYDRFETRLRRKDGTLIDVEVSVRAGEMARERFFFSFFRDVTARKLIESELLKSEQRLRVSQDFANIGAWDWNIETGEVYWSERVWPLLGYAGGTPPPSYENFLAAVHPDDRGHVIEAIQACVKRGTSYEVEHRAVRPDGSVRWLLERGDVTRAPDGKPLHMSGVTQDITERKEAELLRLGQERRQREALVREVHHRIKNNLQGIIGLLQNSLGEHPSLRPLLRDALSQVRSMALVHGLQGKHPQGELLLCEMLPAIVVAIEESQDMRRPVTVTTDLHRTLRLTGEDAVSVALIVNELVTNAIKHGGSGGVDIALTERDGVGRITILARGATLPPDFDLDRRRGLGTGLELVKALMPRTGAGFRIEAVNEGVWTELTLSAPVVTPGSSRPQSASAQRSERA